MSLKLTYLGQNDSVNCTPNVVLTGDPGTDQFTLDAAGFYGGKIVALVTPSAGVYTNQPAFGSIGAITPCDTDAAVPFATLLNDSANEFSGAIGASGSKRAPVVRAMWQGNVGNTSFTSGATVGIYDTGATFTLGGYLFCGHTANANIGQYTSAARAGDFGSPYGAVPIPVGLCTHVPSATEPWLGVASLL